MATSQNIEDMKLPELKTLAKQMGLRGTSTMRKPELLATLQAARTGGQAPSGVTVRAPKTASTASATAMKTSDEKNDVSAQQQVFDVKSAEEPANGKQSDSISEVKKAAPTSSEEHEKSSARSAKSRSEETNAKRSSAQQQGGHEHEAQEQKLFDDEEPMHRRTRSFAVHHRGEREMDEGTEMRSRRRSFRAEQQSRHDTASNEVRDLDDILATLPVNDNDENEEVKEEEPRREFNRHNRRGNERNDRYNRDERGNDRHQRRMRGRDRGNNYEYKDRDNRNDRYNNEGNGENDVRDRRGDNGNEGMVPVAGIVDVLDSYAFIRTSGYLPGPNDVYVSMGQIRKYGLRKGDAVQGSIREPREGERRNQRQKFVPLQSIDTINGMSVEEAASRPQFSKLTPLYPQERLKQETTPNKIIGRLIDLVAPIGKGQRGLIVSPPKAGKTITLQNIANAIAVNNPEVHLMVVLVDERPEEVTDMERTVQGEVISSTFDRPASDHTTVAELAIERAKRLVELGQDVVVLLDSMTRLARAYNIAAPASGRVLSGGVDAQALYPPKKFFGAARNIENGGSLTIISSALVETGSKMDEVIFEEFKGTGNMELRLSRDLANKRLFPAVDINASGTRREELITPSDELAVIYRLRRLLGGLEPEQAYQTIVPRLKKTATNRDFLQAIIKQNGNN
ncbi:transcription termination factor Rho [Bifidobacterium sp. ESL0682]|uniref:transcription termination factor Rho n=1 Tax=Bifidobacterium sp. ESL0682 TaxID=2983212 RepID=UPI0023F8CB0A|nr:transcription termination factor Rho [Bifidobacterium sp. ESL0682]WEV42169.1 transcription termination factor Rho [Bifidobacterium sp. ESL0682]